MWEWYERKGAVVGHCGSGDVVSRQWMIAWMRWNKEKEKWKTRTREMCLWQSTYEWHISLGMGSLRRIGT